MKIIAKANKTKRTFTLRKYDNRGELIGKYRTLPMTREEYEENIYNTNQDWVQFLKSDQYYNIN